MNVRIYEGDRKIGSESGKRMLNLKKFRANDCLFQLKIMGIVFRRGIPVIFNISIQEYSKTVDALVVN